MKMKALEAHTYLQVEMTITEVLEKLDTLKDLLIFYADAYMLQDNQPLLDLEETIAHVHNIEESLKKIDLSFYEKCELKPTCELAG